MNVSLNRVDGLIVFEVRMANPNGDPDASNSPRTTPDGFGYVSNVSMKRKYRDLITDKEGDAWKQLSNKVGIQQNESESYSVLESRDKGFNNVTPSEAKNKTLEIIKECSKKNDYSNFLNRYHDVRLFGTTFLDGDKDKDGDKCRFVNKGCLQIGIATSVAPINIIVGTCTKKYPLRDELIEKGSGDIAPEAIRVVEHGIYVAQFSLQAHGMTSLKTTQKDIDLFKEGFKYIFTSSESNCRPGGSINMLHCWWVEHTNKMGSFNSSHLLYGLSPTVKNPNNPSKSLNDYNIPDGKIIKEDMEHFNRIKVFEDIAKF